MDREEYDVIIIGAGPAGLTAGIYSARNGLKTLILEEKTPGGLAAEASLIENYPGFIDGISGFDLVNRMVEQAKKFKVQINDLERGIKLNLLDKKKIVGYDLNQTPIFYSYFEKINAGLKKGFGLEGTRLRKYF